MSAHSLVRVALAVAVSLWIVSPSEASSFGPDAGVSGGPMGLGTTCTQCHGFDVGPGYTQILNLPTAYQLGETYDLTVRIADPSQVGGGFEFSAEAGGEVVGTLFITDPLRTQFVTDNELNFYITHTEDGVSDSIANWDQLGGMADYTFQWQAPSENIGPIRFYAAGNAINNMAGPFGDTIYLNTVTVEPAARADGDDDGDADFADFAMLQECFDLLPVADACLPFDLDANDTVDLDDFEQYLAAVTGPTSMGPSAYRHAEPARGGKLYDKWWKVIAAPEPTGDHPLYPPEGQKSGSTTFRCKECHGWDYRGVDGAYGSGSHYTGIGGVFDTSLNSQQIVDLIQSDAPPTGHDFASYGMAEEDAWDLAKFLTEFLVDTDDYIDESDIFTGDQASGQLDYLMICSGCHGIDGTDINFGTPEDPEYIGTVAAHNPWEFLHKVRAGQPTRPMPAFIDLVWPAQRAADIGLHAQTLPTE